MSVRRRSWRTKRGEVREAWLVNYTDHDGARRIETFDRRRDAEARHAEIQINLRAGTHTAPSQSPTVSEAAADWIVRAKLEQLEPATVTLYVQLVNHIERRIGRQKLADLTTPGLSRFRDELLLSLPRPLARKVLTALKGILREAQRRGNVAQNVAAGVTIGRDKRKVGLEVGRDIHNADELRRILDAASDRWRPLLVTAALTGLRASELRGLRWEDVDLKRAELRVRQRADRYGVLGRPKSRAGQRVIPLGPMVVNTLRIWRLVSPSRELVFASRTGHILDHASLLRRTLEPAQIKAGVVTADGKPKYTMHALRHFYASWCINRRVDGGLELPAKVVQQRLGHASIVMTLDTYGHLFPRNDDGVELADAERALLSPAPRRS